jgi:ribonucleotide reductase alpha subunit
LVNYLLKNNFWNSKIQNWLKKCNGFINEVINHEDCPDDIKNILIPIKDIYKSAYEIDQIDIIKQAHDRGFFIDQSQSMNLFFNKATPELISRALFYAWKKGLKTGSYYIRSRPTRNALKFTIANIESNCDSCNS